MFVSRTSELVRLPSNESFAAAAHSAITKAGHAVVDMSDFAADSRPPVAVCQGRVRSADVYVGLIGFRWGSAVADDPDPRPDGAPRSYTELEFDTATAAGTPRLVFLLADDTPGTRDLLVDHDHGAQQTAFRARLSTGSGLTRASVRSPAELELAVLHALTTLAGASQTGDRPSVRRVWTIPARVREFTGRDDLLSELEAALQSGGAATVSAVTGMGGVGKTTTAIEYAHRHAAEFDIAWWVPAEDPSIAAQRLAELARVLDLADPTGPPETAVSRLLGELSRRERWLLVFDNAEDPRALAPLLPNGPGQVLITSRNPQFTSLAPSIGVNEFRRGESVMLLRRLAPDLSEAEADQVASAVGDLPLAVEQAGSMLRDIGLDAKSYLRLLGERASELLAHDAGGAYPVSMAASWEVAFDQLGADDPAALELLTLAAWCESKPVLFNLLTANSDALPASLTATVTDPLAMARCMEIMRRRAMATITSHSIQVHRIPAALLRDRTAGPSSTGVSWAEVAGRFTTSPREPVPLARDRRSGGALDVPPAEHYRGVDREPVRFPLEIPRGPTLTISVYHGDLRHVGLPVIVGSNDGTPLRGAERDVDESLGGAVRRRVELRNRLGERGSCESFTARGQAEPAALVVGLGFPGDLSPGVLADLVTQAVLKFAADRLDQLAVDEGDPDGVVYRQIAAVLIGTIGQAPLTIAASLAALVTGTLRANRVLAGRARQVYRDTLRRPPTDPEPQLFIDELRIVELYEERAIEALDAAAQLPSALGGDGRNLVVESQVRSGRAGRPGQPPASYGDDPWRTLRIAGLRPPPRGRVDAQVELSLTSNERFGQAEQRITADQRALVDRLVAETVRSAAVDQQLCNTLFELIGPNVMRGGHSSENLMCLVDRYAAMLPLELLATRTFGTGIVPLVVESGLVRRLQTRTRRDVVRAATGLRALVIADPPGTGLPQLDGARQEARQVANALMSQGLDVTSVVPDGPAYGHADIAGILNALFAREYRVVHVVGHGVYDPRSPAKTGVLIGDGRVLSVLEVEKMSAVPDLFFLNCGHLSNLGEEAPASSASARVDRLAATMASQLVDIGVRAVVAAGWAVNADAATTFAEQFYDGLLNGRDLGTVARNARTRIYKSYPECNTWGAYQVYGPPSFRLNYG